MSETLVRLVLWPVRALRALVLDLVWGSSGRGRGQTDNDELTRWDDALR